jgi:hypothetical protein
LANLSGYDLEVFLPRVAHYISSASPDAALALMNQITDPKLLRLTLVESMYGLVHDSPRMADVVTQIGRLQGEYRASAISELTRKWVREDQEGLIEWVNNLETAADFEAALPMALPQLTPENYTKAIDSLMSQLDGTLDAALIKAATPDFSGATKITTDIIQRLTQLPQYSTIGAGQEGNQDLLWQAINSIAAGWVTRQGAQAPQGAQWIDSLPFRTPADKAAVATQLYKQWKISDPTAAANWATSAGVQVP